jgi:hypothetical protein
VRFAVVRFAVVRFAVVRFAVARFAVVRFAVVRFAVERFAVVFLRCLAKLHLLLTVLLRVPSCTRVVLRACPRREPYKQTRANARARPHARRRGRVPFWFRHA